MTRYVNGIPRGCGDFLGAVPGDFRRATSEAYNSDCLAVTIMLEKSDPNDPVTRYIGSQSISAEIGEWGTKGGRLLCRAGPSTWSWSTTLPTTFPRSPPFADYVRVALGQR